MLNDSGRDPEDSIDFRLDAGPPPKPTDERMVVVTVPLDKVVEKIKRFWKWVTK